MSFTAAAISCAPAVHTQTWLSCPCLYRSQITQICSLFTETDEQTPISTPGHINRLSLMCRDSNVVKAPFKITVYLPTLQSSLLLLQKVFSHAQHLDSSYHFNQFSFLTNLWSNLRIKSSTDLQD
ncbi:hypothetical protein RRG08_033605 [Elysia crispata]|uniref:Uncharacterized protein n=1 Tax=Elysia crispata TaxID=231223 RepID=A0AAE1CKT8_9GAST|nr:hypothetical protein RRG08_033605 [Elysia crispata]